MLRIGGLISFERPPAHSIDLHAMACGNRRIINVSPIENDRILQLLDDGSKVRSLKLLSLSNDDERIRASKRCFLALAQAKIHMFTIYPAALIHRRGIVSLYLRARPLYSGSYPHDLK